MKKITFVLTIIILILNCIFISCSADKEIDVEVTLKDIIFTTDDGEWDYNSMSNMIDNYYFDKKQSVDIEVVATVEVKGSFHICGVSLELGNLVEHYKVTRANGKIGSLENPSTLYEPGIYTISFECENVCFYYVDFSAFGIKVPVERDNMKIKTSFYAKKVSRFGIF